MQRFRNRLRFLVLLATAAVTPALCADAPHLPTNEDLRHLGSLRAPRLSPDGHQVLVQVADSTADGGKAHLWLVDLSSNSFRQLTYTPAGHEKDSKYHGETGANWMPDGQSILFLSHRGEHTQLFRLPMRGGEAVAFDLKIVPPVDDSRAPGALPPPTSKAPATAGQSNATAGKPAEKAPEPVAVDVSGFEIAPNGSDIALWAKDPETPGEKNQHEEKADAEWVDHETHLTRLYLLDPATGKLTAVSVPPDIQSVSWAPQSGRLLAESEAPNSAGDLGPALSTWLVDPKDLQHPVKLALPPTAHDVSWSNDAQHIFFLAQAQADAPPGYADLYEFNFSGGAIRNLSNGYAGSIGQQRPISDLKDDSTVVSVENGVNVGFARFRSGASPAPFDMGAPVARELATNTARSGWVYISSGSTQPASLMYAETLDKARALPTPPIAPPNLLSAASKLVHWQSDGQEVDGLLYLPSVNSGALVPLFVDVHGGPTGSWLDGHDAFTNFIVGQGWAVLRPNPRGSTGRGVAFVAANKNDLGGGDFRDIMAGVDAVLKQFPIDPQRLALFGYSYGGEMAGFAEGKTARFRAIISCAPVIDQFSEYGTEDESWYDRWFFGKPWEHVEDAWRQSPLSGSAHASTPFLLLQGQEDLTDPLGQSQEMYRALRQMQVPVELVEYPRDNHGALAGAIFGGPSSEPWQGFDARRRIVEFIQKAFMARP